MTTEFKPYQQVMQELAQRTPPVPTPAEVRQRPVEIPGVINQTNNLFRPVSVADLTKDNK